jgi:CheY-like chemotaxis protein
MKILLVEDDRVQAQTVRKRLEEEIQGAVITVLKTEKQFREHFEEITNQPPDVICLDVMMRWTDTDDPNLNAGNIPPDVMDEKGGRWRRAGIRCARLLSRNARTRNIPVILYTILEDGDLEDELIELGNVTHLAKDSDLSMLADKIESLRPRR